MSRSYKHTPISKDGNRKKAFEKTIANRKVRRRLKDPEAEINVKGNDHRKITNSWEIADYVCRWSKEEAVAQYEKILKEKESGVDTWSVRYFFDEYPTLEKWLQYWEKQMIRK